MAENGENYIHSDCGIKKTFQQGILEMPIGLQEEISQIHSKTSDLKKEHLRNVLTNYIRSTIKIGTGNEILNTLIGNEVFSLIVTAMQESHFSLEDIDIQEGRGEILRIAIQKFRNESPLEYEVYVKEGNTHIQFGDEKIDISNYLISPYAPLESIRPKKRKINTPVENESSGRKVISSRADVSSREFFRQVDLLIASNNSITLQNAEDLLSDGFKEAFISEMQVSSFRINLQSFKNKLPDIEKTFKKNISGISDEYRDKIIFLCIVESNFNPKIASEAGAIGLWQIMPSTGKKYYTGELKIEDALQDIIISTDIASKYINDVIKGVKIKFPDSSDEEIFKMVLREYNGAWSGKLKPEHREDAFEPARNIYIRLDVIEGIALDTRMSEKEKINEAKRIIKGIQETYFDKSDLIGYIEKKGKDENFDSLYRWSQRYFDKIIKQQVMYPNQVIGAYNAFHELHG